MLLALEAGWLMHILSSTVLMLHKLRVWWLERCIIFFLFIVKLLH